MPSGRQGKGSEKEMQEGGRGDDEEMLGEWHFTLVGQGRPGCVDGAGTGVGMSRENMRLLVGHST